MSAKCVFCGNAETVTVVKGSGICKDCVKDIKEIE